MRATRLPLVLLGLAACGNHTASPSSRDPSAGPPPPPTAARAEKPITEADGLVVLSRGAEPRRALRMTGKIGDASDIEAVVAAQIEALHPGGTVTYHVPATYTFQHRSVVAVDHGRFHVHLDPRAVKIPDRPARAAQIKLEPTDLEVDGHAAVLPSPGVNKLSEQLQQAAGGLPARLDTLEHFRLPETPVGLGAHWRVQFRPVLAGTQIDTQIDLRLTGLDANSMTLEIVSKATKVPLVIGLRGGASVRMDAIEHHGTIRRSLTLSAAEEMTIQANTRYTAIFEYDGERLSETHYRATWSFAASSPPADRPDELKPTASSSARAKRCAARVASLRARMNGWSQQVSEAVDFLDAPVPFNFDAPPGFDPMVRFAPGSLGILLEPNGAVTLRQSRELEWKRSAADAAFVARLLKEIGRTRHRLHSAPMVAVVAAPGTNVSAIEKFRAKLPADVRLGIAMHKTGRALADQIVALFPATPPWVRAALTSYGGEIATRGLDGRLRLVVPDALRAGSLCVAAAPIIGRIADGQTADLVLPAVVDAAEACNCEGIDVDGYVALMASMIAPLSPYGFVEVPADVPFTGTAGQLVDRLRAR